MKKALPLLALLLAFAGCRQAADAEKPAPPVTAEEQAAFRMQLETEPEKLFPGKPATLRVTLTGPDGAPVTGAQVVAGLGMPFHDMGENRVEFSEKGAGVYEGKGEFSMEGPWEVTVTAKAGGESAKKMFDIRVYE